MSQRKITFSALVGQEIPYSKILPGDMFLHENIICIKTQYTRYTALEYPLPRSIPTYGKHPLPRPCYEVKLTAPQVTDVNTNADYESLLYDMRVVQQPDEST